MSGILWFATVLFAVGAFVFREAAGQISTGTVWAHKVCGAAKIFCQHLEYLAYGAGVAMVLAIAVTIGDATS